MGKIHFEMWSSPRCSYSSPNFYLILNQMNRIAIFKNQWNRERRDEYSLRRQKCITNFDNIQVLRKHPQHDLTQCTVSDFISILHSQHFFIFANIDVFFLLDTIRICSFNFYNFSCIPLWICTFSWSTICGLSLSTDIALLLS